MDMRPAAAAVTAATAMVGVGAVLLSLAEPLSRPAPSNHWRFDARKHRTPKELAEAVVKRFDIDGTPGVDVRVPAPGASHVDAVVGTELIRPGDDFYRTRYGWPDDENYRAARSEELAGARSEMISPEPVRAATVDGKVTEASLAAVFARFAGKDGEFDKGDVYRSSEDDYDRLYTAYGPIVVDRHDGGPLSFSEARERLHRELG